MPFKKKYELLFLFILLVPALILRVNVESTKYCTPDSVYYLEVSTNILSGLGAVGPKVFNYNPETKELNPLYTSTNFGHPESYEKDFFAVWPLGYPACIVAVSYITNLSPVWASKLVNIILLALDFYLLFLLFEGSSYLPMYYFGSFTMLEICSYTWSENLYLPFFILFLIALKRIKASTINATLAVSLLSFSLIGMCLARYASVIFFVAAAAIMLYYLYKKELAKSKIIFYSLTIASLLFIGYLYNNYLQCGYLTGMPRANTQGFTPNELIGKFFMGMYHQLHFIRQFRISGTVEALLYIVLSFIQLALMIYIGRVFVKKSLTNKFSEESLTLIRIGLMYLVFLTYMTFTSSVDPFDYRTLLPFSFPVLIAILYEVEKKLKEVNETKTLLYIKLFFIFSIVMNLPKEFLIGLFRN